MGGAHSFLTLCRSAGGAVGSRGVGGRLGAGHHPPAPFPHPPLWQMPQWEIWMRTSLGPTARRGKRKGARWPARARGWWRWRRWRGARAQPPPPPLSTAPSPSPHRSSPWPQSPGSRPPPPRRWGGCRGGAERQGGRPSPAWRRGVCDRGAGVGCAGGRGCRSGVRGGQRGACQFASAAGRSWAGAGAALPPQRTPCARDTHTHTHTHTHPFPPPW